MQRLRPHFVDAEGGLVFDPLDNRLIAYGAATPTNSAAGYQPGCIYINTAGSVGSLVYVNTGTLASSTWTNIV